MRLVDDPAVNENLYRRIGGAHGWVDRLPWDEHEWRRWADGCETHVVELGGEIVGFYELRRDGEAAEIAIFGVLAEHQSRGLGALALVEATRRAFELGRPVKVNTNSTDSPHALHNYLARGFRVVEERGP